LVLVTVGKGQAFKKDLFCFLAGVAKHGDAGGQFDF
jgi:hypothetical protein